MLRRLVKSHHYGCAWQKNIKRHNYSTIEETDILYFRSILPNRNVVTDLHAI